MSHRTQLIVSITLAVACVAALVTSVPVSLPYAYSYTVTETPIATVAFTNSSALIQFEAFCNMLPYVSPQLQSLFGGSCAQYGQYDQNNQYSLVSTPQGYVTTVTWSSTGRPYSQVEIATTTSTGNAPLFHVALNSSLQPYACTHLNLTGAVLFCMMQFWEAMVVLLIALIAFAGLLVYSLVKRKKTQASKLHT